jgi:hypothetical protein
MNFYPIRNGSDLVTHVPPKIFGYSFGYHKTLNIKPKNKYNFIDAHRPESYKTELQNLYSITKSEDVYTEVNIDG